MAQQMMLLVVSDSYWLYYRSAHGGHGVGMIDALLSQNERRRTMMMMQLVVVVVPVNSIPNLPSYLVPFLVVDVVDNNDMDRICNSYSMFVAVPVGGNVRLFLW